MHAEKPQYFVQLVLHPFTQPVEQVPLHAVVQSSAQLRSQSHLQLLSQSRAQVL